MSRAVAPPSAWTFKIKPIDELLRRYVTHCGQGWIDPFAGYNSPAMWKNDLDPESPAHWHMDAEAWTKLLCGMQFTDGGAVIAPPFDGVLFDPPYSYRQISEHYRKLGRKATQLDTSSNFYNRVMNACCDSIMPGGHAISFGWNSTGFGARRGFQIEEIMLVNHGSHHQDTIVTVERKVNA